jgi:hypothetical protein
VAYFGLLNLALSALIGISLSKDVRVRVVRTLWFEDISFWNEPLFDTPVGRLTIRQTVMIMAFAGLSWFFSTFLADIMFKIAIGSGIFFIGLYLALQKVKTIPPEKYLLAVIFGKGKISVRASKGEIRVAETELPEMPETLRTRNVKFEVPLELETPVKIVGVLRDPSTGQSLVEKSFTVFIDGERYSAGVTDDQGFFTLYFAPTTYGSHRVEVRPEGYAGTAEIFEVEVKPKGVKLGGSMGNGRREK